MLNSQTVSNIIYDIYTQTSIASPTSETTVTPDAISNITKNAVLVSSPTINVYQFESTACDQPYVPTSKGK